VNYCEMIMNPSSLTQLPKTDRGKEYMRVTCSSEANMKLKCTICKAVHLYLPFMSVQGSQKQI
jgi:hypothetical protein